MRCHLVATQVGLVALVGCNGIAGIADLRTGDLDGGQAPDVTSASDGSAPANDGSGAADAGMDADAAPGPPACPSPQVGLRIAVLSSASGSFMGVTDGSNNILIGHALSSCLAQGSQVQLQAIPDDSNATHDWGGVVCPAGRRCQFTLDTPTAIDVRLQ
jgi:hypothetical protein